MGKILKTKNLTTAFEAILLGLGLVIVLGAVYWLAPGLRVNGSVELSSTMNQDSNVVDNVTTSPLLPLPSDNPSLTIQNQPRVIVAGYAWNGETPITVANGGPFTTEGSLMEKNGVNLQIVRQDWLSELKTMQMKFIELYDKGQEYPESDKAAMGIMIMGDGAPFYIATMQDALNKKFGKDKYHVQVVGAFGMSNGEDKLIGPAEWKSNPKAMLGSLITCVIGDGDWVTTLNFCGVNNLKINPDFTTYDPEAVNFYPSADDDYINSAKELIASQTTGFSVDLKEVKNGKLTGNTIKKKIDGCATWTPGDKMVFDALKGFTDIASTKDFPNQMATTLIVVKEWAEKHPNIVTNILKSALTASNQIKQYDQWARKGSETTQKTFNLETAEYWYTMFKGQKGTKDGIDYNMGGTRVLTYADAMQYYGITDGTNRYKSVYNQVSNYLVELNPFGFNESVEGIVPYNDAVNLFFLKNINDIEAGTVTVEDYTATKTNVLATGDWQINFSTGSANIESSSSRDLTNIYNLLIQAEQTKVTLVGYTDNTGSNTINQPLSKERAQSVANYLIAKGISKDRIQLIDGKGDANPIGDNNTANGRAKNRRVHITLLQ
jgi:OOP family OmpA-OmpF porin